MKTCQHPACSRPIKDKQFGCLYHWRQLPDALRNRIWAAARAVWADRTSRPAIDELRAAHAAAIEFWKNRELSKAKTLAST